MAETFQVTAQRQTSTVDAQGNVVPVMAVSFTTYPSGVTGSVDVPLAQYDADTVRSMIEARVAQIEAVHSL